MALILAIIAVVVAGTLAYTYLETQSTAIGIGRNVNVQTRARLISESGMEMTMLYLRTATDWRTVQTPGTWVSGRPFGDGTFTIGVEDGVDLNGDGVISVPAEGDGDLGDNSGDPVTITSIGRVGTASHLSRVVVTPRHDEKVVLYVVGNPNSLTAIELGRKQLLQGWGWSVALIKSSDNQAKFDEAVSGVNAVLISDTATALDTKLKLAPVGMVIEDGNACPSFGLSSSSSSFTAADSSTIEVVSTTPYITQPFPLGALVTGPENATVEFPSGTIANGLLTLAQRVNNTTRLLASVESGDALYGGGSAAARRVFLPFGRFATSALTADGRKILQRALEWANASSGATQCGYATAFSSNQRNVANTQIAVQVTLAQPGNLVALSAYIKGKSASESYRYAIYRDSGDEPGNLIAQTSALSLGSTYKTYRWRRVNIAPVQLNAGTYWLALCFNNANLRYRCDKLNGRTRHKSNNAVSNGFSSPWGSSSSSLVRRFNMYGVVAPSSGNDSTEEIEGYTITAECFDWRP